MHSFVRNLITEWRRLGLAVDDATVVIGVSGGADSVSLLLALYELQQSEKLGLRIVAAHFNHRLRDGESDADEQFVRTLTGKLKIEFAVGYAAMLEAGNLEQNARVERYDFLRRTAENVSAFAILTGHTVNDQAETFLMNLIRGSGIDGLCGMKPIRVLEGVKMSGGESEMPIDAAASAITFSPSHRPSPLLIRPLLTWAKRGDTETFCHDSGAQYRYDTMNEDTAFKRVRIRKILLPLLEDMNPKIIETLANTAALMQHAVEIRPAGNQIELTDELILTDIKALPQSKLYDLIRSWLKHHRGTTRRLQLKHIEAIERLILSEKSGKTAELPGGKVTKSGGKLVYDENKVEN